MKMKPEICYLKKNGRVLVFDGCGRHMPEYEGTWTEKEKEIREASPEVTIVDWRKSNDPISNGP